MSTTLSYHDLSPSSSGEWQQFIELYDEAFEESEQEPVEIIRERLLTGRYLLEVAQDASNEIVGFYLLDRATDPDYVILTFLAIRAAFRNQGLGSQICRHIFESYSSTPGKWMLIEAEDRQSIFYGRLGAKRLAIDYAIPHFDDSDDMTATHLMLVIKPTIPDQINGDILRRIIEHIFMDGYHVKRDDRRLTTLLEKIPDSVKTMDWPQN
jgi:predicted N-acetyltransferase YhbS